MSLYAIGDPHLSLTANKPMDVFGGCWENYVGKLVEGFSALSSDDVCVICGDISWGMSLTEALTDFQLLGRLPGKKILLKGNHDYWWSTVSKMNGFLAEHKIEGIEILHNNCFFYRDTAICGTRGWFYEEEVHGVQDKKIMDREVLRLEASLKAAGNREIICFFHYPPLFHQYVCGEIIEKMKQYGVKRCYYGHIHGASFNLAVTGVRDGIDYRMVSADYVNFKPEKVMD